MATIVRIIPDKYEMKRKQPKTIGVIGSLVYLFVIIVFVISPFCIIYPVGILGCISYVPMGIGLFWLIRYFLIFGGYGSNEEVRILSKLLTAMWSVCLGFAVLGFFLIPSKPHVGEVLAFYSFLTVVVVLFEKRKLLNYRVYAFYSSVTSNFRQYLRLLFMSMVLVPVAVSAVTFDRSSDMNLLCICILLQLIYIIILSQSLICLKNKSLIGCLIISYGFILIAFGGILYILEVLQFHPMWIKATDDSLSLVFFSLIIGVVATIIFVILGLKKKNV